MVKPRNEDGTFCKCEKAKNVENSKQIDKFVNILKDTIFYLVILLGMLTILLIFWKNFGKIEKLIDGIIFSISNVTRELPKEEKNGL